MKVKIVNFKDLANKEKNPTYCMSAKRYTNDCHKCNVFQVLYKYNSGNLKKILKKMKCRPSFSPQMIKRIKIREKILKELSRLNRELENEFPLY